MRSCVFLYNLKCVGGISWETAFEMRWHAQKPDFAFRRNGRVHLNRRGRQFSRLLAADVCASALVMLDTPCSEVVWRVLATHSIRQIPLHFPSRTSPYVITFQLDSTINAHRLCTFCVSLPLSRIFLCLWHELLIQITHMHNYKTEFGYHYVPNRV